MIWIIIKMLLKVLILAPFFSLWFLVDTVIGFVCEGWKEIKGSNSPKVGDVRYNPFINNDIFR